MCPAVYTPPYSSGFSSPRRAFGWRLRFLPLIPATFLRQASHTPLPWAAEIKIEGLRQEQLPKPTPKWSREPPSIYTLPVHDGQTDHTSFRWEAWHGLTRGPAAGGTDQSLGFQFLWLTHLLKFFATRFLCRSGRTSLPSLPLPPPDQRDTHIHSHAHVFHLPVVCPDLFCFPRLFLPLAHTLLCTSISPVVAPQRVPESLGGALTHISNESFTQWLLSIY